MCAQPSPSLHPCMSSQVPSYLHVCPVWSPLTLMFAQQHLLPLSSCVSSGVPPPLQPCGSCRVVLASICAQQCSPLPFMWQGMRGESNTSLVARMQGVLENYHSEGVGNWHCGLEESHMWLAVNASVSILQYTDLGIRCQPWYFHGLSVGHTKSCSSLDVLLGP